MNSRDKPSNGYDNGFGLESVVVMMLSAICFGLAIGIWLVN